MSPWKFCSATAAHWAEKGRRAQRDVEEPLRAAPRLFGVDRGECPFCPARRGRGRTGSTAAYRTRDRPEAARGRGVVVGRRRRRVGSESGVGGHRVRRRTRPGSRARGQPEAARGDQVRRRATEAGRRPAQALRARRGRAGGRGATLDGTHQERGRGTEQTKVGLGYMFPGDDDGTTHHRDARPVHPEGAETGGHRRGGLLEALSGAGGCGNEDGTEARGCPRRGGWRGRRDPSLRPAVRRRGRGRRRRWPAPPPHRWPTSGVPGAGGPEGRRPTAVVVGPGRLMGCSATPESAPQALLDGVEVGHVSSLVASRARGGGSTSRSPVYS